LSPITLPVKLGTVVRPALMSEASEELDERDSGGCR